MPSWETKAPGIVVQDQLQRVEPGAIVLKGHVQERIQQQIQQRFDEEDLHSMVEFFAKRENCFASGELWGKNVRSLCRAYRYTLDPRLKAILDTTVADMLATQTPDGCISSFSTDKQPYDADLWCRKYVLLALEGYYEITHDENVMSAMMKMADYTLGQVGPAPKVRIIDTGWAFEGIESSSILEPMVRLYDLTGEQRYLDFAKYIVESEGGCKRESIFEAVAKGKNVRDIGNNGNPKESIAKQYELISCFEGLTEYFRATGNSAWKEIATRFLRNVLDTETTVIGSGGGLGNYNQGPAPFEQFNNSRNAQVCSTRDGIEGCSSARWIALNDQLLRVTADSKLADNIESTIYNALLGSIKPDGSRIDYHTRLNGFRPAPQGFKVAINGKDISCCVYNVVDAVAMIPFIAVMNSVSGPVVNLFHSATATVQLPEGNAVQLEIVTEYPKTGPVLINVAPQKTAVFSIRVRIPEWSKETTLLVNGVKTPVIPGTYADVRREWSAGDKLELNLDMRCRLVLPPEEAEPAAQAYRALVRGPVALARDKRLGDGFNQVAAIVTDAEGHVDATLREPTIPAQMQLSVPTQGGGSIQVIDFASAGGTWTSDSEYFTWIPLR